jgi:hypothetical protein
MSEFGKIRARQIPRHAERRSVLPAVAGVIAAVTVGGLAVLGWNYLRAPGQWSFMPALGSSNGLSFSGNRNGRATTAPFLKICLPKELLGVRHETDINAGWLLQSLEASATQGRLTAVLGAPKEHAVLETALIWGQVADCIYRQNSWHLCDIDNRALAVDAGNTFLRQADHVIAEPAAYAAQPGEIRALAMTKDRVLEALRSHVRTGVLIASDFAPFAPSAITHALHETKTVENGCAKK